MHEPQCPYKVRETGTQSWQGDCVKTGVIETVLLQAKLQGLPDNTGARKRHRDPPHLDQPLHEPSVRAQPH